MCYTGASLYLPQAQTVDKPTDWGLSDGLIYMKITHVTKAAAVAEPYLDPRHGLNENEKHQLALVADAWVHIFTQLSSDTPLQALLFDSWFPEPGQMDALIFRMVDRQGAETRRAMASYFQILFTTSSVVANSDRWILVVSDVARGPYFWGKIGQPLIPVGFSQGICCAGGILSAVPFCPRVRLDWF